MTKTVLGMYPYGICAAAAVVWFAASGLVFSGRKSGSKRRKEVLKASCAALLCALVLSRLVFCASNYIKYFIYEPSKIPALTEGGLSMWGALFGMFAGAWLYSKAAHTEYTALLDLMTPGMLGTVAIMRFGERYTFQSVGKEIRWRALEGTPLSCLDDWGYPVFAVYRMELFCAAAMLILAMLLLRFAKRSGMVNVVCLSLLSAFQVVFECMKDVGYLYIYYIRITQAMAVLLMLIMLLARLIPQYGKRPAVAAALTAAFLLGCGIVVKMSFAIDTPEQLEMNLAIMLFGSLLSAASVIAAWLCVPASVPESDGIGEAAKGGNTFLWLSVLFIVILVIAVPYLIPSGMNI